MWAFQSLSIWTFQSDRSLPSRVQRRREPDDSETLRRVIARKDFAPRVSEARSAGQAAAKRPIEPGIRTRLLPETETGCRSRRAGQAGWTE